MLLQCLITSTNTDDVVIIAPISNSINHTCHHMAYQTNLSSPPTNHNDTMTFSSSSSITWGDFPVPMQSCSYTEHIDPQDQQVESGDCIDYQQPWIYPRKESKVEVSTVELQHLEKSPSINSIIDMNADNEVVIIQRNDIMNFNDNKTKSYGWNDFPVIEFSDWTHTTRDENEGNNDKFTSDDSSLPTMISSSQDTTFIPTVDACPWHLDTVENDLMKSCSRRVRFSTINIRYYNVTLGDHPLCCSYPLSLDWSYNHEEFSDMLPENVATSDSASAVTTCNNISTPNFVQSHNELVYDLYSGGASIMIASLFPHRPHCRRLSVHERQQRLLDNMNIPFNELQHLESLRLQSINF